MRDVLEFAKRHGIRCLYIPTPLSEEKYEEKTTSDNYKRLSRELKTFKAAFPVNFDYTLDIQQRPALEFTDRIHLRNDRIKPCAEQFLTVLGRFAGQ